MNSAKDVDSHRHTSAKSMGLIGQRLIRYLSVSDQQASYYKQHHLCWPHIFMGLLLFAFFLNLVMFRSAASSFFYPMVLVALWGLYRAPETLKLEQWEIIGLCIVIAWFVVAVISHIYNDFPGNGDMMLQKRYSKLLYAIPIFLYFRRYAFNVRWLWLVGVLLCVEMCVVTLLQQWNDQLFAHSGWYQGRVSANIHPIPFALIAVCAAIFTLGFADYKSKIVRLITSLAILMALYAMYQSGSRGIWAALPVLGYLLLWFRFRQTSFKPILFFTLLVVIVAGLSYKYTNAKIRVDIAVSEVEDYFASTDVTDAVRFSSIGGRLEMWRASGAMFSSSPWLGVGPDGFRVQSKRMVESGQWSEKLLEHMFPHNIFLTALTTQGLLGLAMMLALYLACLRMYARDTRHDSHHCRQIAITGLLVSALFIVGGLSDDNMGQKLSLTIFALTQALLLGHLSFYRRQRQES